MSKAPSNHSEKGMLYSLAPGDSRSNVHSRSWPQDKTTLPPPRSPWPDTTPARSLVAAPSTTRASARGLASAKTARNGTSTPSSSRSRTTNRIAISE